MATDYQVARNRRPLIDPSRPPVIAARPPPSSCRFARTPTRRSSTPPAVGWPAATIPTTVATRPACASCHRVLHELHRRHLRWDLERLTVWFVRVGRVVALIRG